VGGHADAVDGVRADGDEEEGERQLHARR
jgi:hypothetical protein